jgi:hypothetical protein
MRRTTLSTSPTAEIIDHGQMPQLGIGFQVLEHLIPIPLGHLNVESIRSNFFDRSSSSASRPSLPHRRRVTAAREVNVP